MDTDIEIICMDKKIMILPSEIIETGNEIPPELIGIFRELGISKEKVNVVLHSTTEREIGNGKTDL